jgi:hypothetical protein
MFNKITFPVIFILSATFFATEVSAKCSIILEFKNNDSHKITVLGDDSQSRVNGGLWSKMNFNDVTLEPGDIKTASWTPNMSCNGNAKRDVRFKYIDKNNNVKYPNLVNNIDFDDGQRYQFAFKND